MTHGSAPRTLGVGADHLARALAATTPGNRVVMAYGTLLAGRVRNTACDNACGEPAGISSRHPVSTGR